MTSEGFSLRDLIRPGDGAALAMQREMDTRAKRELAVKPTAWRYAGEAHYLKRHGQSFKGAVTPERYRHLIGQPTQCHNNALKAAHDDPSLRFFTGYYTVGQLVCHHSWCMAPDGTLVELTYPTFDVGPGARMVDEHGNTTIHAWMPPEYWAYHGLEFKLSFLEALSARYDGIVYMPIFEPDWPFHAQLMTARYSPDGFPIPKEGP